MSDSRILLLLRHAEAETTRPGARDRERSLTERGRRQASAVGDTIRDANWAVDHVICSSAVRTRETLAGLELPPEATVEIVDSLYEAGTDSIIELIRTLPADARCTLLVGHAPGIPGTLYDLVDPSSVDSDAWVTVENRFPPATIVALTVGEWAELADCRLVRAVLVP